MTPPLPSASLPARAALLTLTAYRRAVSPAFYFLGVRCRHAPTCSAYSMDAFKRHGATRGFWLTAARVTRCHPFGSSGWDPVPETLPDAGWKVWRYGDWKWTARSAFPSDGA